jgi:hypothetical protein
MSRRKTLLFGEDKATGMLAKALAQQAFRDPLEDLHAGDFPRSRSGDYTDVKVVTPYEEIPWNDLMRISDDEMKSLMIEVVDKLYTLLVGLDDVYQQASICALSDAILKWDEPKIDEGLRKAFANPYAQKGFIERIVSTIVECEAARRSKVKAN